MGSQISLKSKNNLIKKKLSLLEGAYQLEKPEFALAIALTKGDVKNPKF